MTRFAEVAVDAPVSHSRTFSYSIPDRFRLAPGQLVWVPFGRRILQGLVTELTAVPSVEKTRDILQPIEPGPLLDDRGLSLAYWISRYYLCSLFDAVDLFLPPGFKAQVRSQVLPLPVDPSETSKLKQVSQDGLKTLAQQQRMTETEFAGLLGRNGTREVNRLVDRGLVHRRVDMPRPRTFRYASNFFPVGAPSPTGQWPDPSVSVSARQEGLLQAVREGKGGYSTTQANREFGFGVGDALVEKGLLALEWVRQESRTSVGPSLQGVDGEALPPLSLQTSPPLTPAQADALARILDSIESLSQGTHPFLLHGVTGSGKTEVYLQAISSAVEKGCQAIYLVPEIALTPQTVQRVNARFPGPGGGYPQRPHRSGKIRPVVANKGW